MAVEVRRQLRTCADCCPCLPNVHLFLCFSISPSLYSYYFSRHIAVVPASVRHTPGSVPTEPLGIGNADFNAGLKESKYGYPLLELYELVCPVTLVEMKSRWRMGGAPMGWRYLGRDLWEDRWGEDEGRAGKVTQVF